VTGVLVPPKPVHILHVFCIFRFHRGVAHFDDVYVRPLVAQVRAAGSAHYGSSCVAVCSLRSLAWGVLRVLRTAS
jgi:hypothetical protein